MPKMSDERLAELYAVTLRLVAEHGFDKVTMDQIAEATRSSKATLYRQWGGKERLVVDALVANPAKDDLPDTGTLRGDMVAVITGHPDELVEDAPQLVPALLQAILRDDEIARVFREEIVGHARADFDVLLDRAVARGELADDHPDAERLLMLLITPVVLHRAIHGTHPTPDDLTRYVDEVLLPVLTHRPTPSSSGDN